MKVMLLIQSILLHNNYSVTITINNNVISTKINYVFSLSYEEYVEGEISYHNIMIHDPLRTLFFMVELSQL